MASEVALADAATVSDAITDSGCCGMLRTSIYESEGEVFGRWSRWSVFARGDRWNYRAMRSSLKRHAGVGLQRSGSRTAKVYEVRSCLLRLS